MTEPIVERAMRKTSSPAVSASSRAARLRRLALRGLVVAGFAGGLWLLSSTAAHAVESQPSGGRVPRVSHLLAPQETHHGVAGKRHAAADERAGGTTQLTAGLTGLTGLLEPLTHALTGTLSQTVRPVTAVLDQVTAPVTGAVVASANDTVSRIVGRPVLQRPVPVGDRFVAPARGAVVGAGAAVVGDTAGTATETARVAVKTSAGRRHIAGNRPATVGSRAGPFGTELPILPRPAPLPAYPGSDITGMPTTLAGSHLDGGPCAVVPSPVACAAVARRPAGGTDVTVRRLHAKGPTVSPD
jgi:hypothetical protein